MSSPLPPQDQSWDNLLSTGPSASPQEIQDAARESMGLDVQRRRTPRIEGDPERVREIREELGLA